MTACPKHLLSKGHNYVIFLLAIWVVSPDIPFCLFPFPNASLPPSLPVPLLPLTVLSLNDGRLHLSQILHDTGLLLVDHLGLLDQRLLDVLRGHLLTLSLLLVFHLNNIREQIFVGMQMYLFMLYSM